MEPSIDNSWEEYKHYNLILQCQAYQEGSTVLLHHDCRLRAGIVTVVLTTSGELALKRPIGLLLWIKLITFEKTESFMLNCPVSLVGIYNGEAM